MQDAYAGDIGDFGKFALLRALAFDSRVGIIWYLTSESNEKNDDGRHLGYLCKPERFRNLDRELFDQLFSFRAEFKDNPKVRSVSKLEQYGLLNDARYFSDEVPIDRQLRRQWVSKIMQSEIAKSELIFLDPDNGIEGDLGGTHKHVALDEIRQLRRFKKPLVIYHHQTRRKGGARVEAAILKQKIRELGCERVELIRLRPYSSRFYILADHNDLISQRLAEFVKCWKDLVEVYQNGCH
jgi:hypothetical protein